MALASVANLVTRLQSLLDDPAGQWATYDYLAGFILQANEDLNAELDAYNLSYNEQEAVLAGIPAGTSDLSAYMTTAQPLENLLNPISVEWRPAGTTDDEWQPVKRVDKKIDDVSATEIESWEWRGQIIYITAASQIVDLRVRFDAITVDFADPSSTVLRGALNVLAYRTARLVSSIRGGLSGSGKPLAEEMQIFEMEAKDSFEALLVKRSQAIRRRFGRNGISRSGPVGLSLPVR